MNDMYAHVSVRILEKEYQVSCPAKRAYRPPRLRRSTEPRKCGKFSDSGKVVGLDRIAVMAALNMANELLHAKAKDEALENNVGGRLKLLSDRVDSVLGGSQQLDL